VKSSRVDGNQVLEVFEKIQECVTECRNGKGPFLVECLTFRKSGHHVNDPGQYMPADKVNYYAKHDPLILGRDNLDQHPDSDSTIISALEEGIEKELEKALDFAKKSEVLSVSEFMTFINDY